MAAQKKLAQENTEALLPTGVPRKPLLFATNPFDDARLDDPTFATGTRDIFYIPGYSELKSENETRASKGLPLKPCPRLYFARVSKKGGVAVAAGDEGMVETLRLGYRACGLDDLEQYGFGFPLAANVGADGLIRIGDLALFIVGEDRANRNRSIQKQLIVESSQRDPKSGDRTGGIYEVPEDRRVQTGSLEDLATADLSTLE